jgi:hypothetical protein
MFFLKMILSCGFWGHQKKQQTSLSVSMTMGWPAK